MSTLRPLVSARRHAVSSGHELATAAAMSILEGGGNAVDAGVAAGIALGVLHCDIVNVAGVAPIILRMANTGRVVTIDGLGHWPKAASVAWFEQQHSGTMPEGLLRTVIPAAPAAWIRALRDFGTIRFADVARAAIRYAREGFAVYPLLAKSIADHEAGYRRTADTARVYLPNGRPPRVGETFVQADLAATLQFMSDQDEAAGADRERGFAAAHDAFYRGDIAKAICEYHAHHGGLITRADLAEFEARLEEPLRARFAGCDFFCCGAWSQGISMAQALTMLERSGVRALGHNSSAYIHTVTELMKLVFSDREAFVADPRFIEVPVDGLLDPAYAERRLESIDAQRAWPGMPPSGDPKRTAVDPRGQRRPQTADPLGASSPSRPVPGGPVAPDTSHVGVVDRWGNMFAATPSDPSYDTEVIPGTGLSPSSRGSQSRAVASSINSLAPGKRPRLTPNPVLALRDNRPFMTLGTPGGDVQIQAMAQVLANILWFDMDVQTAIEAPRFATYSFPSSFAPNEFFPSLLMLERRLGSALGKALADLGHDIGWWDDWTWKAGGVCAIVVDHNAGSMSAGADPRRASAAAGI